MASIILGTGASSDPYPKKMAVFNTFIEQNNCHSDHIHFDNEVTNHFNRLLHTSINILLNCKYYRILFFLTYFTKITVHDEHHFRSLFFTNLLTPFQLPIIQKMS